MNEGIPRREFETPDSSARCARHPESPAFGTCTRCGTFACHQCSGFTPEGLRCFSCQSSGRNYTLADRGSRFAANLIDSFVITLPFILVFGAFFAVAIATKTANSQSDAFDTIFGFGICAGAFVGFGVGIAVQLYCLNRYGRSLGKKWLNMRVVRTDGSEVNVMRLIFLRNVVPHMASQLCGIIGLVDALMIFGEEQKCLHDLIADTMVIVDNGIDARGEIRQP